MKNSARLQTWLATSVISVSSVTLILACSSGSRDPLTEGSGGTAGASTTGGTGGTGIPATGGTGGTGTGGTSTGGTGTGGTTGGSGGSGGSVVQPMICNASVEAETMDASTGEAIEGGWNIWTQGTLTAVHDFKGGETKLTVYARGSIAGTEWPNMIVKVGGETIGELSVDDETFSPHEFTFTAPEGSADIVVEFTNDGSEGEQDRNLYVDKVEIQELCDGGSGTGGTSGSGGSNGSGGSGGLGPGPNLPDITGGDVMWASRYWDCCKTHCAWQGGPSCGIDGVSSDGGGSSCEGGSSFACYNEAPRAIGTNVSYGYIAKPNPTCGTCYHLQFTGAGHHNPNDEGARAIAGKHMIVKVTNTGGDVAGNQFDLMIPGGGIGAFPQGCPRQWNVSADQLGAQYGGFATDCGGSHEQKKQCVREKCNLIPAGDARDGCYWFVDWFNVADNPEFRYEEIQCPSDL